MGDADSANLFPYTAVPSLPVFACSNKLETVRPVRPVSLVLTVRTELTDAPGPPLKTTMMATAGRRTLRRAAAAGRRSEPEARILKYRIFQTLTHATRCYASRVTLAFLGTEVSCLLSNEGRLRDTEGRLRENGIELQGSSSAWKS